jgi:uncharacterized protein (TIGR03067 family)
MFSFAMMIGLVSQGPDPMPPTTELEGAWVGEWSQRSGGPRLPLEDGSVLLVFSRDAIMTSGLFAPGTARTDKNPVVRFSLNTQAVPKQIDYWEFWELGKPKFQGPTILAVYELTGDELRLTIPTCDGGGPRAGMADNDATGPRPTLVSGDQPCSMLLVLKRR